MSDEYYRQCRLRQKDRETIAWIPERGAKKGNSVELLSLDGKFWKVTEVSEVRLSKSELRDNERNYKEFQGSLNGGGID